MKGGRVGSWIYIKARCWMWPFNLKLGLLASLSDHGWILLWQAAVEPAQVLEGAKEGFSCLSWHPTGEYLAAGGQQGEVLVWTLCSDARQRLCTHPEGLL